MPDLRPILAGRIAEFAYRLRNAGIPADRHAVLLFTQSLARLGATRSENIYWAGRLCFVKRVEQLEVYEHEFLAFLQQAEEEGAAGLIAPPTDENEDGDPNAGDIEASTVEEVGGEADGAELSLASSIELLRSKNFDDVTADEAELLKKLIARIQTLPPTRVTRRTSPASRGRSLDLRRMLTESMRTEGDPVRRRWQRRTSEVRPTIFLLDISGSMKAYSRNLLQFAYALRKKQRRAEVFCFGTSLSRVTRELNAPDVDTALRRVTRLTLDWDGGTRISDSLKGFINTWGRRGMARGAVIVICSDGLERGDPLRLGHEMRRLNRLAHSIVWVNPLKGSASYEPLARGMDAALPYIDTFLPGHNMASLEALSTVLASIGAKR